MARVVLHLGLVPHSFVVNVTITEQTATPLTSDESQNPSPQTTNRISHLRDRNQTKPTLLASFSFSSSSLCLM